jgi:uncharacterized protein (DUF924 family)
MALRKAFSLNKTVFNPSLYRSIREVWFGDVDPSITVAPDHLTKKWFGLTGPEAKSEFDKLCYKEFSPALESINPDKFPIKNLDQEEIAAPFIPEISGSDENLNAQNAISLLILLDQIPRNLYREPKTLPLVFSHYDPIAQSILKHILKSSPRLDHAPEIRHSLTYRSWFYYPLMHSETLEDHLQFKNILDECQSELRAKGDTETADSIDAIAGFEKRHMAIIERFGRYPHRNTVLGREMTKEEDEYLSSGGERFGVSG